jgi:hypothetical protein
MNSEDKFYDGTTVEIDEKDLLEEPDYAAWEQKKSLRQYWMPLTIGGMGIFVLAMIFAWIFVKPEHPVDARRLERLDARLTVLEEKLALLEQLDAKMIGLETQNQRFQAAVDRFDQAESSISMRMDLLAKKIENIQSQPAPPQPATVVNQAPKPATVGAAETEPPAAETPNPPPKPDEHVVQPGDTLYSISRKYGLSVPELLQRNNLDDGATIYPGQKLSVAQPE